jgi:hypothetical protein
LARLSGNFALSPFQSFPASAHRGAQEGDRKTKRERKADTRRKILVGAVVMAKVEQKVMDEKQLRGWLDEALTRADYRALLNLPAKG